MKRLLALFLTVSFALMLSCNEEEAVPSNDLGTKSATVLTNVSTIYRVESNALWTTTLNQLQVLTKFTVTAQTTITLDGSRVPLSHLRPGYKVRIDYYTINCQAVLPCNVALRVVAISR